MERKSVGWGATAPRTRKLRFLHQHSSLPKKTLQLTIQTIQTYSNYIKLLTALDTQQKILALSLSLDTSIEGKK